ncbi:SusD/RagB family nutrient-binding outer membrane lipoprotein, partial [Mucilaginibacter sp.]|uniref:SusD/RagB family nutrient-binding outer membrane lipoprotein n=1 Tax=Mucilaginibacter sp. TaxID=1882438 RepID=UPI002ED5EB92
AVAKILQQYIYWIITDSWGDVPYSQALKGSAVIQPAYDTQESIYKGIISTLTSAISEFDSSSSLAGDIIYSGDVASWKRMANSLKLLAAIQLSNRVPAADGYAATAVKEAIASGVITANAQNFTLVYPGGSYKSPWYSLYNGRKDYGESKTLTDITAASNDPRQEEFGGASELSGNVTTSNIGVPYGLIRLSVLAFEDANPTWARILRGDLRLEAGSVVMINAAEVWLARAEAANLGWTDESITTDYTTGITASFEQWDAGTPSAAYLAFYPVTDTKNADITGSQIKNISIQRWIASYPDGHAAWAIWRKTGWPALTPAPDATNSSGQIVRRFTYASSEYNTNGASVNAAVARLSGGDTQDAHVWWDTRTSN